MDLLSTLPPKVVLYALRGQQEMRVYLSPGACLAANNIRSSQMIRTCVHQSIIAGINPETLEVLDTREAAIIAAPIHFEDWLTPTARQILLHIKTSSLKRDCSFVLERSKCHGPPHWLRVSYWGLRLYMAQAGYPSDEHTAPSQEQLAGNPHTEFISCFAVLHDLFRMTDDSDPGHGRRAVEFLSSTEGSPIYQMIWKAIGKRRFGNFLFALLNHSLGQVTDEPLVGLCWDADRYDLTRSFEIPNPALLSTAVARESRWTL